MIDTTDEEFQAWNVSTAEDKYKQTRTCSPGMVVQPKRGKAIMWYNHYNDRGWLGEQHERSLHGGCNVIQGEAHKAQRHPRRQACSSAAPPTARCRPPRVGPWCSTCTHRRRRTAPPSLLPGRKWIANHWISHFPHLDRPRKLATSHY